MKASPHSRLRKYRNLLCLAVKPFYRRFVLARPRDLADADARLGGIGEAGSELHYYASIGL